MTTAQQHFDELAGPLCPTQLSAPVLHAVLRHAGIQHLILGGKGVGSQGDGSAQLLCRDEAAQMEVCRVLERDLAVHCLPLTMAATGGEGKEGSSPRSSPTTVCVVASSS